MRGGPGTGARPQVGHEPQVGGSPAVAGSVGGRSSHGLHVADFEETRWAKRPSNIPRWLPARLHAWLHETSQILCVEGLMF